MMKEKRKNAILIFLLILIAIFILASFYIILKPLEVRKIEVSFTVAENAGFDLNKSALTFGKVMPENIISRRIIIENNRDFPVKINVFADKNIMDYLDFENSFFIEGNGKHNLVVVLKVPKNAILGEYKGIMKFIIEK